MDDHRLRYALASAALACSAPLITAQLPLLDSPSRAFRTGDAVVSDAYGPQHVACADMDGDGAADLVVAHVGNTLAPMVSVMLNLGDGSFGEPVNYDAPGQTMEVVLEDLDGDGDRDAAFAQSQDGSAGSRVLVYENAGDGTLLPYVSYTVGTGPTGLIASDVDLDGDIDLVSANFFWLQEDVSVLYNDGTGAFPTRTDFAITGENPIKVAAGDLTGDGAPELVVSLDGGDPAFAVLTNDGSGAFSAPTLYSTGSSTFRQADVAVADIDKDGDADVLYGTSGTDRFALFRNDGGGTLSAHESIPVTANFDVIYDFAVSDVTGDSWPDVLGTSKLTSEGFVLVPGDGSGGFLPATSFRVGEYTRSVTTADVDNDGDPDAIFASLASLTVTVHKNDGTGFSMPTEFPVGLYVDEAAAGDVDQDGDLDLVTGDGNNFYVLDNQGDGTFALDVQPNFGPKVYTELRDLDGDGFPDAIFAGVGLSTALNDGAGTFGPITSVTVPSAIGDLDTLDMDNDGDLDAVLTGNDFGPSGFEAGFFALENDGVGSFGPATFIGSTAVSSTGRVATGDFDGDGNEDVLAAGSGELWLWPGDGARNFGAPRSHDLGIGGAASLAVADLDGDGHLDAAGSDWGVPPEGETLTVVFGNGDGTFSDPVTTYAMYSQWLGGVAGLDCGDVDADGDLDLFGGCRAAADVALFLNNGDRTFAPEQRYGVDGDVLWVVSGDFDGNGRADVAANIGSYTSGDGGVTILLDSVLGPYVNLGFALPGSGGIPVLAGAGTPSDSAPVALELSAALPMSPSILLVSQTRIDYPLLGGTLVPALDAPLLFVTEGDGSFTFNATWPTGLPIGTTFYAQAWTLDPPAPTGMSASNAIQAIQQL